MTRSKGRAGGFNPASGDGSQSRLGSLRTGAAPERLTLGDVSPQLLVETLDALVDAGCLVSMSRTSDGGAICLYVKDGADQSKYYGTDQDDLTRHLEALHGIFHE